MLAGDYWDKILIKILFITGSLLILFSLVSLTGWLFDLKFLTVINKNYLPIAPVTASFFVIFGIVFIRVSETIRRPVIDLILKSILLIILIYSFLKIMGYLTGSDLILEDILFPGSEKVRGFPVKHMSPLTGLLFIFSSFSLLLLMKQVPGIKHRNIAAILGTVITMSGFISELGYLYDAPFLYSGNTIPMASRTGISFLITGLGIIFTAGRKTIILKHLTESSPYSKILRIFLPFMIFLFIIQGILDVFLSHKLQINEALVLALGTILSVGVGIPLIVKVTSSIFYEAIVADKERQRLLEELKSTLSVQQLLLENNPLGICMVSDDKIQWTNSGFCNIFSKKGQNCQDISFSELFSEESRNDLFNSWLPELRSGKAIDIVIELTPPGIKWLRLIGSSPENGNDTSSVIWIVEDITERKNQRETMRLLSHTLSSLSECVSITDTSDLIIFVNKAFENTYGYSASELIGKGVSLLGSDKNPASVVSEILPATFSGVGWSGELINRRKDGSEFPVYLSTSRVVNEKNETVALVGIAVDITDRKKAEIREKEYLELVKSSNDAKDRLFGIISHDLRSPFTSILGLTQILTEQYDILPEDEKKSFLFKLKKTSENTFNLVENLLIWSRSQREGIAVTPTIVSLSELINRQKDLLSEGARNKNIAIENSVSGDFMVYADAEMIGTVIRNLVNNAIKFTNRGGTIRLAARKLEKEIELSVSDNGIGITSDKIETIFRLDKTSSTPGTEKEKGTGLGLLICKEFVEKNGGRIKVESQEGKGSIFSFNVPCA
jgi:PAS domain S-box-containing protein